MICHRLESFIAGAKRSGVRSHYQSDFDAADFDEGRPGGARNAPKGGRTSHTSNFSINFHCSD